MDVKETLLDNGFDDIVIFEPPDYDEVLIGVSSSNRAIYDYDKMIECLMKKQNWTLEQALEWIEFNTIGSLPLDSNSYPIVMYPIDNEE